MLDFRPPDIVEQITLLEFNIFRSLSPSHLTDQAWTKPSNENSVVNLLIKRLNIVRRLCLWSGLGDGVLLAIEGLRGGLGFGL